MPFSKDELMRIELALKDRLRSMSRLQARATIQTVKEGFEHEITYTKVLTAKVQNLLFTLTKGKETK